MKSVVLFILQNVFKIQTVIPSLLLTANNNYEYCVVILSRKLIDLANMLFMMITWTKNLRGKNIYSLHLNATHIF